MQAKKQVKVTETVIGVTLQLSNDEAKRLMDGIGKRSFVDLAAAGFTDEEASTIQNLFWALADEIGS